MNSKVQADYEPAIAGAREETAASPILKALLNPDIDARLLERFLIEYCSLGVQITAPVDGWIRRAGQRCLEQGLVEIGEALVGHAKHEAGHDAMFVDDTRALVDVWNSRRGDQLDAEALLSRPPTTAMRRYIDLHEANIAGPTPYAQVAIELEVERLSVVVLPDLLAQFRRVLGDEIMGRLTFLGSHAELDVGHTHLNTRMMERLLEVQPDASESLADAGAEAMRAYMLFFEECMGLAAAACGGSKGNAAGDMTSAPAG